VLTSKYVKKPIKFLLQKSLALFGMIHLNFFGIKEKLLQKWSTTDELMMAR